MPHAELGAGGGAPADVIDESPRRRHATGATLPATNRGRFARRSWQKSLVGVQSRPTCQTLLPEVSSRRPIAVFAAVRRSQFWHLSRSKASQKNWKSCFSTRAKNLKSVRVWQFEIIWSVRAAICGKFHVSTGLAADRRSPTNQSEMIACLTKMFPIVVLIKLGHGRASYLLWQSW